MREAPGGTPSRVGRDRQGPDRQERAGRNVLVVAGMLLGWWLPDLDLEAPWLFSHRDMLLHSVLPLLLVLRLGLTELGAGVGLGLGMHFAADLFPRAWKGTACVHLPLDGSALCGLSPWWFAVSAAAATWIGLHAARRALGRRHFTDALGISVAGALCYFVAGGEPLLGLAVFLCAAWTIWRYALAGAAPTVVRRDVPAGTVPPPPGWH